MMQQLQSNLQSKRGDDGWPGDRVPATNDAEVAYQRLDPNIISVFKHAMLADRQAREQRKFPSLESAQALLSQPAYLDVLSWPTSYFSASLSPVHSFGLEELVQTCHQQFLCKSPFLKEIPPLDFLRTPRPEYLTLALASMGASMLEQREEQSLRIWQVSVSQLVGIMDIDNSVARKTDLVKAWILLETFAFLSANRSVRRRARMIHGCVKTAVWRILRDAPYFDEFNTDEPPQNTRASHGRSLISYFLLIDLLRAIQHGQSTSFPTALFLRRKHSPNTGSSDTAESFGIRPVGESSEDALIAILSLLADIHLVTHTFSPLATQASQTHDTVWSPAGSVVHVPFTPSHEMRHLRQKLSTGLSEWKWKYFESAPQDLLILYYFSQLYNMVPSLQSLYAIVGYAYVSSSTSGKKREREKASETFLTYRTAISTAWLILESSELLQPDELPVWAPLSVFSAALVIWARREFSEDEEVDSRTARSLYPFQQELARMQFSGARDMATILSSLTNVTLPQT